MKEIKQTIKNNIIEIIVYINENDWTKYLDKSKKELIENLEIKGFRKGKIPEDKAMPYIQTELFDRAINAVIDQEQEEIFKILGENRAITQPSFNVKKVSNYELEVEIFSDVIPEINLNDYKKIKIEYTSPTISDNDVEKELESFKHFFEKETNIEDSNYEIQNGDFVKIDFVGMVNDKEFDGGSAKDFELEIGSNTFIDDFEEQLMGLKIGDSKDVVVKFPNEYPSEELKGKDAIFKVKINSIKQKNQMNETERITKLKVLGFNSLEEFKSKIKESLKYQKQDEAKNNFFQSFIEKIKEEIEEPKIPEKWLLEEVEKEFDNFEEKVKSQNLEMKDYLKMLSLTEEEFKEKNLKLNAKNRIIDGLIFSKLLESENISLDENDYDEEYDKIAKLQNNSINEIKKQIKKDMLTNTLMFNKLVNSLIKN